MGRVDKTLYKCNLCEKTREGKPSMKQHLANHDIRSRLDFLIEDGKCSICLSDEGGGKVSLFTHISEEHSREMRFEYLAENIQPAPGESRI